MVAEGFDVMQIVNTNCKWMQDEDGTWHTECGNMFEVTEGTPHENQMHFCTYCGKHLEQHIYTET